MVAFGVTLDACVLFPPSLRDTLLISAERGLYRPLWTPDILAELRRNLVEHRIKTEETAVALVAAMEDAFPDAAVTGYQDLVDAMPVHPGDRHVAAAAVAGHAQVIVTINLRHFPNAQLARYGIEAQGPDEFLTHLLDLYPSEMVAVVEEQARQLKKPPAAVEEILDRLAKTAPTFAEQVRRLRGTKQ